MMTMTKIDELGAMLGAHVGKIGTVQFRKKNGELRTMTFRQAVRNGTEPLKGGRWSNSDADPADYHLVKVTDMEAEARGEKSRRAFILDSVVYLRIGGEVWGKLQ